MRRATPRQRTTRWSASLQQRLRPGYPGAVLVYDGKGWKRYLCRPPRQPTRQRHLLSQKVSIRRTSARRIPWLIRISIDPDGADGAERCAGLSPCSTPCVLRHDFAPGERGGNDLFAPWDT